MLLVNLAIVWITNKIESDIPFHPGHLITLIALAALGVLYAFGRPLKAKIFGWIALGIGLFGSLYAEDFLSKASGLTRWITVSMLDYMANAALALAGIVGIFCGIIWVINLFKWLWRNAKHQTAKNDMETAGARTRWVGVILFTVAAIATIFLIVGYSFSALFPEKNTFVHEVTDGVSAEIEKHMSEYSQSDQNSPTSSLLSAVKEVFTNPLLVVIMILGLAVLVIFGDNITSAIQNKSGFIAQHVFTDPKAGLILLAWLAVIAWLIKTVFF